jgi:predicted nuclease of predicted toxin-antitoxin system
VRFLVDENLPARFAQHLRDAGHEASHIVDHDLRGAPDDAVMALARREKAVVITYDADFAAMLIRGGEQLPSVVLFRDQRRRPEELAERLVHNLEEISRSLIEGAIAVFDPARIRIRSLPSKAGD